MKALNLRPETKQMLAESTWVTIGWEWIQTLLGRAVDSVLWVTMIFAGYQLIPGAPQPYQVVSITMFVAQFIALDIGGLALNQMAKRQGLPKNSYARIVAYILIGITLATITFSGIEHAIPTLDPLAITVVEVTLVVARSVMTVLYNQAIHSLKAVDHAEHDRIAELEQQVSTLTEQVSTEQGRVHEIQSNASREVSTLTQQVSTLKDELSKKALLLSETITEAATLRIQLEGKDQQLTSMRDTLDSGMKIHEQSTQQVLGSLKTQLSTALREVSTLTEQLSQERHRASTMASQLSTAAGEVSSLREQLSTEQQKVSTLTRKMDNLKVSTRVHVDTPVDTGKVRDLSTERAKKSGLSKNDLMPQAREILLANPTMSGRALARELNCSPTIGNELKTDITQELQLAAV